MENTPPPAHTPHQRNAILICVSDHQEAETALRYGCLRAKRRHAQVAILHVIEPADFEGLIPIGDVIRQEKEEEAQALLNRMADIANQEAGIHPILILKEGKIGEEIVKTTLENSDISMVILGLSHDSKLGPKLVSWLTTKMGNDFLVPLMLVPGNLTDAQLAELA